MNFVHGVTHWDPDNCYGCRLKTVSVAPSATPTRCPTAARTKEGDRRLSADLDAYKRMRQQGLQPKATTGAADIERHAESPYEVESGYLAKDMAKGRDAGKTGSRKGQEWRRRANEAHAEIKPAMEKQRRKDLQEAQSLGAVPG